LRKKRKNSAKTEWLAARGGKFPAATTLFISTMPD